MEEIEKLEQELKEIVDGLVPPKEREFIHGPFYVGEHVDGHLFAIVMKVPDFYTGDYYSFWFGFEDYFYIVKKYYRGGKYFLQFVYK